jgi:hypothetical protein
MGSIFESIARASVVRNTFLELADCVDCGGHFKAAPFFFGQPMLEREMRRAEQRINGISPNSMPIDTVTKGTEIKERVYRLFDGQAEMMEFKAKRFNVRTFL